MISKLYPATKQPDFANLAMLKLALHCVLVISLIYEQRK